MFPLPAVETSTIHCMCPECLCKCYDDPGSQQMMMRCIESNPLLIHIALPLLHIPSLLYVVHPNQWSIFFPLLIVWMLMNVRNHLSFWLIILLCMSVVSCVGSLYNRHRREDQFKFNLSLPLLCSHLFFIYLLLLYCVVIGQWDSMMLVRSEYIVTFIRQSLIWIPLTMYPHISHCCVWIQSDLWPGIWIWNVTQNRVSSNGLICLYVTLYFFSLICCYRLDVWLFWT